MRKIILFFALLGITIPVYGQGFTIPYHLFLRRDGNTPMIGDLDMGDFGIDNVSYISIGDLNVKSGEIGEDLLVKGDLNVLGDTFVYTLYEVISISTSSIIKYLTVDGTSTFRGDIVLDNALIDGRNIESDGFVLDQLQLDTTTIRGIVDEVYGWGDHSDMGYSTIVEVEGAVGDILEAAGQIASDLSNHVSDDSVHFTMEEIAISSSQVSGISDIDDSDYAKLNSTNIFTDKNTFTDVIHHGAGIVSLGGNPRGQGAIDLQLMRENDSQVASGDLSFLVVGNNNTASGVGSVSLSGFGNVASGMGATVISGQNNTASGVGSIIISGGDNLANNDATVTIAGEYHEATGPGAVVIGGFRNKATDWRAIVLGGQVSEANAPSTAILGSEHSKANDSYSAIIGGTYNIVDSSFSFIGSGAQNKTEGFGSSIVGGGYNITVGGGSFIGGGQNNKVEDSGYASAIIGGKDNIVSGQSSFVSGENNEVSGEHSVISGGRDNIASRMRSTVAGGSGNKAEGNYSFIGGGAGNTSSNSASVVSGGMNNKATGILSFIGGGENNKASGRSSIVLGGANNTALADYSTVGGGRNLRAFARGAYVIGDEEGAYFSNDIQNSFAARFDNGYHLHFDSATAGLVLERDGAEMTSGSFIFGNGTTDFLHLTEDGDAVFSGPVLHNGIQSTGGDERGLYAVDLQTHRTDNSQVASGDYSSIGGGRDNTASGEYAGVCGGYGNKASGNFSFVGSGYKNTASGNFSAILGGSHVNVEATGASAMGDGQGDGFINNTPNSLAVRFDNGVRFAKTATTDLMTIDKEGAVQAKSSMVANSFKQEPIALNIENALEKSRNMSAVDNGIGMRKMDYSSIPVEVISQQTVIKRSVRDKKTGIVYDDIKDLPNIEVKSGGETISEKVEYDLIEEEYTYPIVDIAGLIELNRLAVLELEDRVEELENHIKIIHEVFNKAIVEGGGEEIDFGGLVAEMKQSGGNITAGVVSAVAIILAVFGLLKKEDDEGGVGGIGERN